LHNVRGAELVLAIREMVFLYFATKIATFSQGPFYIDARILDGDRALCFL
jgi:hypothetical protein